MQNPRTQTSLLSYGRGALTQFQATLDTESAMVANFHEWTLVFFSFANGKGHTWRLSSPPTAVTCPAMEFTSPARWTTLDTLTRKPRGAASSFLEKKVAQLAAVFMTVSDITDKEAKRFLGRQSILVMADGLLFDDPLEDEGSRKKIILI